jgi:hypothetical protein
VLRFRPLRALDERVLPRLARGLSRILGWSGSTTAGPASTGVSAPVDDPSVGGGRRARVLGVLAVVSVATVVATAVYLTSDTPPSDLTVGEVVRVGAVEGDQVSLYTDRARAELGALVSAGTAETYALVSLRGYATPGGVVPVLRDVETVRAFVRLPIAQVQTPIVSFAVRRPAVDIAASMARVAAQREAAALEDEKTAAGLSGEDPRERELQAFYTGNARLDRAEAAAYREGCACVYAVVVRATPVRLAELASRAGVRVVDPAPEVRRLDRTVFLPLLPEQTAVVTPPPDQSLPVEPLVTPSARRAGG